MMPIVVSSYMLVTVKILVLVALVIYAIFAGVLVRQEQLMANVLEEQFQPILRIFVLVHLIAALLLLVLAIIVL